MLRGWRLFGPGHLLCPVAEQEHLMIEIVDVSMHEGGGERVGCLPERPLQARPRVQTLLVPGGHDPLERVRVRRPVVGYCLMTLYIFLIGRQQGELKVYPIFLEGDTGLVSVTHSASPRRPMYGPWLQDTS